MIHSFISGGDTGVSYEALKRKQEMARAMWERAMGRAPRNMGEGLSTLGASIGAGLADIAAKRDAVKVGKRRDNVMQAALGGFPMTPPRTGDTPNAGPVTPNTGAANTGRTTPTTGGSIFSGLLAKTEGGGKYDTLFGFSNRPGGRFAGVDITKMTLDELAEFTKPSGAYGQWVKAELGRQGQTPRVATPLGAGQIVGSTLQGAAAELGLPGDTVFSPEIQDKLIAHLAKGRLRPGMSQEEKRAAMRAEWKGFKSASNADLDAAIAEIEGGAVGGAGAPTTPPATGGNAGAGTPKMVALMAAMRDPSLSPEDRAMIGALIQREAAANKKPDPIAVRRLELAENADARAAAAAERAAANADRAFDQNERRYFDKDGNPIKTGTTVNVGGAGESAFEKEAAKGQAALYKGWMEAGVNAKAELGSINELEGLLSSGIGGTSDNLQLWFQNKFGINVGVGKEAEAFGALINRLIPAQRPPGSGVMSDKDVEMFRNSLPQLINSPEGNAMIVNTMRAMADYKIKVGEISAAALNGVIDRNEAGKRIAALEDPLTAFKASRLKEAAPKDGKEEKKPVIPGTPGAVDGPAVLDMKSLPSSIRENAGISDDTKRELAELLAGVKSPEERAAILKSIGISDD